MTKRDQQALRFMILDKPHGMFVVTGPTGSGKSTTLYAALQHLNRDDRNIVTVEDPVEFRICRESTRCRATTNSAWVSPTR